MWTTSPRLTHSKSSEITMLVLRHSMTTHRHINWRISNDSTSTLKPIPVDVFSMESVRHIWTTISCRFISFFPIPCQSKRRLSTISIAIAISCRISPITSSISFRRWTGKRVDSSINSSLRSSLRQLKVHAVSRWHHRRKIQDVLLVVLSRSNAIDDLSFGLDQRSNMVEPSRRRSLAIRPDHLSVRFWILQGIEDQISDGLRSIKTMGTETSRWVDNEVNQTCDRLLTDEDDKKKSTYDKIQLVGRDAIQRWSSKQELIDAHEQCIGKYRKIFVTEHQFKEFHPPGLIVLDNPLMAGGYYYEDNFYLNVCDWNNGNFKNNVENLTLHETVPGHHPQLEISYRSPNNNYLTALDGAPCNGFVLRTSRWFDIQTSSSLLRVFTSEYFSHIPHHRRDSFHVEGKRPADVIELGKQYLTTSEECITAEICRYRVHSGQACAYKTGLEVFEQIIDEQFSVTSMKDFTREDLLQMV